ncbi:MAG: hypothetical protein AABW75_01695 [Nanoarchaeota archaeon]
MSAFSSKIDLSLKCDANDKILFTFGEIGCILQSCFNMLSCKRCYETLENSGNYVTNSPEFSNGQSSRTKFLNASRIKILDVLKISNTINRIVHINNFFGWNASFKHLQDLLDHNSSSFECEFSMTDIAIRDNVFINFDSHKEFEIEIIYNSFHDSGGVKDE